MCDAADSALPHFDKAIVWFRRCSPLVDKLVRAEVVCVGCVFWLDTEGGKVQPICQNRAEQRGNDRNISHLHVSTSACVGFMHAL